MTDIIRKTFGALTTAELYALLRLRVDVFVVEQEAAYPELDGRDAEPGTVHLWVERDGDPVAYLRLLAESDGSYRIGRVCAAKGWRGRRLADRLMAAALDEAGDAAVRLDAQTYALGLYERHGFTVDGDEYTDDDGIPHVPMARGTRGN